MCCSSGGPSNPASFRRSRPPLSNTVKNQNFAQREVLPGFFLSYEDQHAVANTANGETAVECCLATCSIFARNIWSLYVNRRSRPPLSRLVAAIARVLIPSARGRTTAARRLHPGSHRRRHPCPQSPFPNRLPKRLPSYRTATVHP